jgi:hypothetical protein
VAFAPEELNYVGLAVERRIVNKILIRVSEGTPQINSLLFKQSAETPLARKINGAWFAALA